MFVKIWEVERQVLQGEKKVHVKQAVMEKNLISKGGKVGHKNENHFDNIV